MSGAQSGHFRRLKFAALTLVVVVMHPVLAAVAVWRAARQTWDHVNEKES